MTLTYITLILITATRLSSSLFKTIVRKYYLTNVIDLIHVKVIRILFPGNSGVLK